MYSTVYSVSYSFRRGLVTDLSKNSILARVNGRSQIDIKDVAECEELFLDARRSADLLSGETGRGFIS